MLYNDIDQPNVKIQTLNERRIVINKDAYQHGVMLDCDWLKRELV